MDHKCSIATINEEGDTVSWTDIDSRFILATICPPSSCSPYSSNTSYALISISFSIFKIFHSTSLKSKVLFYLCCFLSFTLLSFLSLLPPYNMSPLVPSATNLILYRLSCHTVVFIFGLNFLSIDCLIATIFVNFILFRSFKSLPSLLLFLFYLSC